MKTLYFFCYSAENKHGEIRMGNIACECEGELNLAAIEQLKKQTAQKLTDGGFKCEVSNIAITFFAPIAK